MSYWGGTDTPVLDFLTWTAWYALQGRTLFTYHVDLCIWTMQYYAEKWNEKAICLKILPGRSLWLSNYISDLLKCLSLKSVFSCVVGDEGTGILGNMPEDQLRDMLKNQLEYYFSRYAGIHKYLYICPLNVLIFNLLEQFDIFYHILIGSN